MGGDLVKKAPVHRPILSRTALAAPFPPGKELAADVEKLGPTYIKLAQFSPPRDMMPQAYMMPSRVSRTTVEPFSSIKCRPSWRSRSGGVSQGVLEFEIAPSPQPRLGQVHRAVLRSVRRRRQVQRRCPGDSVEIWGHGGDRPSCGMPKPNSGSRLSCAEIVEELKSAPRELAIDRSQRNLVSCATSRAVPHPRACLYR